MQISGYALAMTVWAALLVGFLAGCFWAGRPRDEDTPARPRLVAIDPDASAKAYAKRMGEDWTHCGPEARERLRQLAREQEET